MRWTSWPANLPISFGTLRDWDQYVPFEQAYLRQYRPWERAHLWVYGAELTPGNAALSFSRLIEQTSTPRL